MRSLFFILFKTACHTEWSLMPVIQLPEILPVFYSIGQCFLVAGEVEIHGMAVYAAPDILHGINRFADYHLCSGGSTVISADMVWDLAAARYRNR